MALGIVTFRSLGHFGKSKICFIGSVHGDIFNDQTGRRFVSQEVRKTTKLSSLKRGTGGRSSFSGVIATVFGASGLLGCNVVNGLGKVGSQVLVPYRGDHYDVLRLKLAGDLGQILYFPFNLKDEDSLRKAMKYSNVVINLIGKDIETKEFPFEEVNVKGPRTIARIAKELGIKKLIHVSALNADEKPTPVILKNGSGFLASKFRGEAAVLEEFPEAVIFRPSDMWGLGDNFVNYYGGFWRQFFHRMPLHNKGRGIYKMPVAYSDVAEGIINAIFDDSTNGQTFEAFGPNRYELAEMVDWFHRIMRKTEDNYNFKITNLKYSPFFQLKVQVIQSVFRKYPRLSWERMEREHVTDTLAVPLLPNLETLGVKLTYLEDKAPFLLRQFRAHGYYVEDFGEFDQPAPPKLANFV